MPPPSKDRPHTPSEIFAAWLAHYEIGRATGLIPDFAELLRDYSQHAAALERLHADWLRGQAALDLSLSKRLENRFGEKVDPEVSLRSGDERAESFSSEVLQRLSGRSSSFGRYQLKGEIARGGMGAIVKVWDEDLRRHLAMKVILGQADAPSSTGTPPVTSAKVARFLEEAQVTGQLDHPGIVPVHELGLDPDGRVYFTMKLVKGRTLKHIFDLVAEGKEGWTQTKALGVLLKVCEAMAYAHDKGVIHRDLKPGNIMVGKFGEVHVMDWGLARILDKKDERDIRIREEGTAISSSLRTEREEHRGETPESPLYTMDGDVVGTPAYMPPEQAAGKVNEIGPHSDVYAMGAMLYHLIAGHMPYVPKEARLNNYAVWSRVQEGPPTAIAQLVSRAPAEFVAICNKAMARDWKRRYRDMSELADDLSAYLERRVVRAYETGTWAETKKWMQRNQALATSLAAAIVILLAGAILASREAIRADAKAAEAQRMTIAEAAARREAQQNETRANKEEQIAAQRATELAAATKIAQENEEIARRKAGALRSTEELNELIERADTLWPANLAMIRAYDEWLGDARLLINGRVANANRGEEQRPSLKDHEEHLAQIRVRARPLTDAQAQEDRSQAAEAWEWERSRRKLTWVRRMLGSEPWPLESDIEAALEKDGLSSDPVALDAWAWPLVDPFAFNAVHGSEMEALVLAKRAFAAATGSERATYRDTLAWALFSCGRLDQALAECQVGLQEAKNENEEGVYASLCRLPGAVESWRGDAARAQQFQDQHVLALQVADLEQSVNVRRTFEFDQAEDRWWYVQLFQLVQDLNALTNTETGLFSEGTSKQHGWGILRRRNEAATVEKRSISGEEAKRRWKEAISSIATSSMYGGMKLSPQLGLMPIGEDPDSHLWEFAHLQTGDAPQRGADGKLRLMGSMGLVFVLVPPGKFVMGAQNSDPRAPNFDPQAQITERLDEVELGGFFLSKFEMTQGQWARFTGSNPSSFGPVGYGEAADEAAIEWSALQPVEQVSWTECSENLKRMQLVLPTEAQWERGARGATQTAWWTGGEMESLRDAETLGDGASPATGSSASSSATMKAISGRSRHGRVGSHRANAFGLHDIGGNVSEWCRDGYEMYDPSGRADDGERLHVHTSEHVVRGGSFNDTAPMARSAFRTPHTANYRSETLGVRPARAIQP